ncbi:MAG: Mur ligase family protein [Chloroflexi bacterium]|nr:Mur ligase family protein [Chloroflexota bacterium]MCL5107698.1 Mur ligase family protein [Chloroflexota bacterium]
MALSRLSAAFHDFPARRLGTIGITGTNGKTTTAYVLSAILAAAGIPAGRLSTVDVAVGRSSRRNDSHHTTPQAPQVQASLAEMVQAGLRFAVVEASSHSLAPQRVRTASLTSASSPTYPPSTSTSTAPWRNTVTTRRASFACWEAAWIKACPSSRWSTPTTSRVSYEEDPAAIRAAIELGLRDSALQRGRHYLNLGDRGEAIAAALALARPGNAVLLAGRGHELYQPVGQLLVPFDDAAVARDLLSGRGNREQSRAA